ncbi:hypothetical protein ACFY2R_28150 [Micromonospora olivasterospora]|uniref:hypothetical protein n=1 Tax=Micromonospora olivasterospora TaxID=1880 RepID=UPI0011A1F4F3|nr:hypothetical protein [Micromonospora olivasterospora]
MRVHFADGIRAMLHGLSGHDCPAGSDRVCRWGWHAVSRGVRVADVSAAHRDTWRPCNDRDVRAAVGVLVRFGRCASAARRMCTWRR